MKKKTITELTVKELIEISGGNAQQGYILIRVGDKLIWVKGDISST